MKYEIRKCKVCRKEIIIETIGITSNINPSRKKVSKEGICWEGRHWLCNECWTECKRNVKWQSIINVTQKKEGLQTQS